MAGSIVGLVLLVGVGVPMVRRRWSAAVDERSALGAAAKKEAVVAAAAESLAELRIERDVRQAIIACYAQMERSLGWAGMARRPSEAPLEYLARVLVSISGGGLVLTNLYERAMFSREPMGEREKQRAIEALEALQQAAFVA